MAWETPPPGILETTIASAQTAIDNQNQKISDEQDRITTLTTSLTAKIDAADALIASLEQQSNLLHHAFRGHEWHINKNQ